MCKHAFTTPSNLRRHARHVHREDYGDGVTVLGEQIRALLHQSRAQLYQNSTGAVYDSRYDRRPRGLARAADQMDHTRLGEAADELSMGTLNPSDAAAGIAAGISGLPQGMTGFGLGSISGLSASMNLDPILAGRLVGSDDTIDQDLQTRPSGATTAGSIPAATGLGLGLGLGLEGVGGSGSGGGTTAS